MANRKRNVSNASKSPRSGTQAIDAKAPQGQQTSDAGNLVSGYTLEEAGRNVQASLVTLQTQALRFMASSLVYLFGGVYGRDRIGADKAFEQIEGWVTERGVKKSMAYDYIATARKACKRMMELHKLGGINGEVIASTTAADAETALLRHWETGGVRSYNGLKLFLSLSAEYTDDQRQADVDAAIKGATASGKRAIKSARTKKRDESAITHIGERAAVQPAIIGRLMEQVSKDTDTNLATLLSSVVDRISTTEECDLLIEAVTERKNVLLDGGKDRQGANDNAEQHPALN